MRKLGLTFALVFAAAPLAAQGMPWKPEIGLNLNYTVTTVEDEDITTIGVPSGGGYASIGGVAGLYGIIPINERFAVEPSIGFQDLATGAGSATIGNFGARLLYSISGGFYAGGGASLALLRSVGNQTSTWGFNVAGGYRRSLTAGLSGRAEVYYEKMGENAALSVEDYSSIGLKLGLGLTPTSGRGGRRSSGDAMWSRAIGFQGGFSHVSSENGTELLSYSIPGSQGSILAGSQSFPGVNAIFMQFPLGERIAVEPSLGYSSFSNDGIGKGSALSVGARALYAFNGTLYAGVSFDMTSYGGDFDLDATTGYGVVGGARFPLLSGLTGRVEMGHGKFSADDAFLGDFSNTTISFAVIAPID